MEPVPVTSLSGPGLDFGTAGPVQSDRLRPVPVVKNPDRFHLWDKEPWKGEQPRLTSMDVRAQSGSKMIIIRSVSSKMHRARRQAV
jgi:hypothetical protein